MARQLGWGLAGLPYPAETWPAPDALARRVMRVDREDLLTAARTLPETGPGTQDGREGGQAARATTGVQWAECNGRFKAEQPESLAQLADKT